MLGITVKAGDKFKVGDQLVFVQKVKAGKAVLVFPENTLRVVRLGKKEKANGGSDVGKKG